MAAGTEGAAFKKERFQEAEIGIDNLCCESFQCPTLGNHTCPRTSYCMYDLGEYSRGSSGL